MTEKSPNERSGAGETGNFERRDLLKGITLGAAGLAGAGSAVNGVVAQDQEPDPQETDTQACQFSVDYVATVPEGEPATESRDVFPDGPTSEMDLVFGISFQPATDNVAQGVVDDTIPLGYYLAVVTDQPPEQREIVTRAFEEYDAHAFAESVSTDAGGNVQLRESISLEDLGDTPPEGYVAVLSIIDLRGCCSTTVCKPFQVATAASLAQVRQNQTAGNQTAGNETAPAGNETEGNASDVVVNGG